MAKNTKLIVGPDELSRHGIQMRVRYVPRVDFILLERIKDEADLSIGGIVIPDEAKSQSNKGRVVASGEGRWIGDRLVPTGLVAGDVVVFSKYGAEDLELDGEQYLLMRADEVKLKEVSVLS